MLQVRNKRTTLDKSLLDFLCFAKLCGTRVFNVDCRPTMVWFCFEIYVILRYTNASLFFNVDCRPTWLGSVWECMSYSGTQTLTTCETTC